MQGWLHLGLLLCSGFLSTWDVFGLQVQPIAANAPFMVLEVQSSACWVLPLALSRVQQALCST